MMLPSTQICNKPFEADYFLSTRTDLSTDSATSSASMEDQDLIDLLPTSPTYMADNLLEYCEPYIDFDDLELNDFEFSRADNTTESAGGIALTGDSAGPSTSTASSSSCSSTEPSPSTSAANSPEHPYLYSIGNIPSAEYLGLLDNDAKEYENCEPLDKYLHSEDIGGNIFDDCMQGAEDSANLFSDNRLKGDELSGSDVLWGSDNPASFPSGMLSDVGDDELGQVFGPLTGCNPPPVPDSIMQTTHTPHFSTYSINADHCYNKPHYEPVIKEESESSESSDDDDEDYVVPIVIKKQKPRVAEEKKYQIVIKGIHLVHDEVDRADSESSISNNSYDPVHHEDRYSEIKCERLSTNTRALRPIVKPKRFSQRENTPPVRQYKKDFNKKEAKKAATAMLNQTRQNQKNPKTVRSCRRGRRPANSLSSSPYSSRTNSEMEEPVLKRNNHNTMERHRRDIQRTALHNLRDAIPHLRHNSKVSKVKIINSAKEYIDDQHFTEQSHLGEISKLHRRNLMLKARFAQMDFRS